MWARILRLLVLSLLLINVPSAQSQALKIATLNVWSGLDYHGFISMGEYESPDQRERRFLLTLEGLKAEQPDIIALQEANPVHAMAGRLADSLGYDVIAQRVNAGLKLGPLGIPWNLNEGLVFLARKEFRIAFEDVWDLAHQPGIFGNVFSLHAKEQNIALVALARYGDTPIYLINVHTCAAVPEDSSGTVVLTNVLRQQGIGQQDWKDYFEEYHDRALAISEQLEVLAGHIRKLKPGIPKIVAGDFNITAHSPAMQKFLLDAKLKNVQVRDRSRLKTSWDPLRNTNIAFSRDSVDASHDRLDPSDLLGAWYDGQPRTIDYVLVDSTLVTDTSASARLILDEPRDNVFASDHYGLIAEIPKTILGNSTSPVTDSVETVEGSEFEPLPILSYDTDVGFGYGAKVFYLNPFKLNESFDVVLFNSTKGERWYRLVFSIPDFEVRQAKIYPFALDVVVDYDKYLKNSFFGVGNASRFTAREYYTREPLEVSIVLNRGFSASVVGQFGLKYKYVRNFNYADTSQLETTSSPLSRGTTRYYSLFATYRFDSRNSYINPARGLVLQVEAEYVPQFSLTNVNFSRVAAWVQYYATLFYPKSILAARFGVQGLAGSALPVQVLLPIGGNQTVRGSPQDRYLDKYSAVANVELRFPLAWRFSGIVGFDAGKVWHAPGEVDLARWATNPVGGLRFSMDTYIVRLDVGFGKESTGFYLNFGHLF